MMKVVIKTLNDEAQERRDYSDCMAIEIDGIRVFEVYDGEPEDNNLGRNFGDCYTLDKLINLAHTAGKSGSELEITKVEVDEI
jgi:hypothetical protein